MVLGKLPVPGRPTILITVGQGPTALVVGAGGGCLDICTLMDICTLNPFRVVLGWAYRGLTGGFLLLQNFSAAFSVSPHVCFILVLILISMFLR